jgi:virginiamycin B lyase
MTTSGVVTTFPFPAGGRQKGITSGPDGNLWYATSLGIATMTTAGVFLVEHTVPGTPLPGTRSIVAGPDGNLWFTLTGNGTVGRMTTAGAFTEFPVPTAGAFPFEITVGPDGALWFTERGSVTQIGRITISGSVTEFPVAGGAVLNGIGSGPDGNIWFGLTQGLVGRVTPSGVMDLFSTPTAGTNPFGFTTGPDGALWFTERSSGCSTLPNYAGIGRVAIGAAQPTPTPTVPPSTPTVTPPIGPGPASEIPMLSPGLLALFGLALAGLAVFLIRRA